MTLLYGTAWKEDETERLVGLALAAGFRAIDTANQRKHYHEPGVGDALATAYAAGVVRREDLFLQTKFTHVGGQDVVAFARGRIRRIRVESSVHRGSADDASVRILQTIGDDPMGIGNFLLDVGSADTKAACLAAVSADQPVPFGHFVDVHPASYWRYYHAIQTAKALTACTVQTAARRTPAGTGRAIVTETNPTKLVDKGYGRGTR